MTTADAQPTGPEITGMVRSVAKLYTLAALDETIRATVEHLAKLKAMRRGSELELSEPNPFRRLMAVPEFQPVYGVKPDPGVS
jgi:hypothetical protein